MSSNVIPSPDAPELASATSQGEGNESSGQADSTLEGRSQVDLSKASPQELLQQIGRLHEQLDARNRDYGASKQEAVRQSEENKRLAQELQTYQLYYQMGEQAKQQQKGTDTPREPASRTPTGQYIDREEASKFYNAIIEGKPDEAGAIFDNFGDRVARRVRSDLEREQQEQSERTAGVSSLQRAIPNDLWSNPEFSKLALEKYAQIASDPVRSATFKPAPIKMGTYDLNANMLREAALEAKADFVAKRNQQTDQINQNPTYNIEPSPRGQSPIADGSARPKLDPNNPDHIRRLMSEEELDYCRRTRSNIVEWFKWLPDQVKQARIETGKPITATNLNLRTVR